MDLLKYLNGQQSTFLKSATYEVGDKFDKDSKLRIVDNIDAGLVDKSVIEVIFTRKLFFEPENYFKVEISMGSN